MNKTYSPQGAWQCECSKMTGWPTEQHLIRRTGPPMGAMWAALHRGAPPAQALSCPVRALSQPHGSAREPTPAWTGAQQLTASREARRQVQAGSNEGQGIRPGTPLSIPRLPHPAPPGLTWLCSRKAKSHCSFVIKGYELCSVKRSTQCLKLQTEHPGLSQGTKSL